MSFCRAASDRTDTPERVDAVLLWMDQLSRLGDREAQLEPVKFSTAVKTHIKFSHFLRAAALVHKMIDGYVSGRINVILDFKVLSTIINGLCTSCCALEAEALLRRICKYSRGIKGFRSTDDLLQAVLKALNSF